MSSGWRLFPWIVACAFGCGPPALAGGPAAAAPLAVAHSALLTIDAVEADDSLAIRIRRAADHTPVNSRDVIVSVDGRSVPVTLADGAYVVSAKELRGRGARVLEIVVAHDGIREILSRGNGADQQLRIWNANRDIAEVVRELSRATEVGIRTAV